VDDRERRRRVTHALRELVRQAEREVVEKPVEYAIAFNSRSQRVLDKLGTEDGVPLTEDEQGSIRGAIVVHNHPRKMLLNGAVIKNAPPSVEDDLDILLSCRPKELHVVTDDYISLSKQSVTRVIPILLLG
jgi:hypothetical protein